MALIARIATDSATQVGQAFAQNLAHGLGGYCGLTASAACNITVRGGPRGGERLFGLATVALQAGKLSDGFEVPRGIEYLEIEIDAAVASFTAWFLT